MDEKTPKHSSVKYIGKASGRPKQWVWRVVSKPEVEKTVLRDAPVLHGEVLGAETGFNVLREPGDAGVIELARLTDKGWLEVPRRNIPKSAMKFSISAPCAGPMAYIRQSEVNFVYPNPSIDPQSPKLP